MSSTDQQLLTAQELWLLPGNGKRRELVRGEVIERMPPGGQHGRIAGIIFYLLQSWVKEIGGGYIAVEAGYVLEHDPDTVRGAAFLMFARIRSLRRVCLKHSGAWHLISPWK